MFPTVTCSCKGSDHVVSHGHVLGRTKFVTGSGIACVVQGMASQVGGGKSVKGSLMSTVVDVGVFWDFGKRRCVCRRYRVVGACFDSTQSLCFYLVLGFSALKVFD